MRRFIEKSLIIIFCLYNTYKINPSRDIVFYFLMVFILSFSLDLFTRKHIKYLIYLLFAGLVFYDSLFVYYLPLIIYNLYIDFDVYSLLALVLALKNFSPITLIISLISVYLSAMSHRFFILLEENKITRDELKEDTILLRKYNEQLQIDREKNIHIAILTERNRIARELHDSIGHGISSSILQVEALKLVSDNSLEGLEQLQDTLKRGMKDIRDSIHNLYKESFDLENKIEEICSEIKNLDIKLIFKIEEDLPFDLKFDILSVVKEGITNSVKHSNGTELEITLLSQPKFYSIIIRDNGSKSDISKISTATGIGLLSMEEIANKYKGFLNYGFDEGFKIHLVLMKG